jgi:predicted dehydrogenase/threonine dehydrogenase-like Zn-dependent dehydrogenase
VKQVAQNYRSGELSVLDVPTPTCAPGGVLVRSQYSLISTGTEMMKVSESKKSLIGKARARPDQVKRVLDVAQQQGPVTAYKKAMGRLDSLTPLGYSFAGTVLEVGAGVNDFVPGQLVACAGSEFAFHAEVNWIPKNLCVAVPETVAPEHAAFATVGAIALQGIRQADIQIGDVACVIGLGLVGQLVVRLLVAASVQVVGIDVVPERCRLAEKAGALACGGPGDEGVELVERAILRASGGLGADRIFLAAGGSSNAPTELAARLARDRARVVDIGKCKLDLPWTDYYEKELELRFSRSYGPGRYDPQYEVGGTDYPAGYVRWTERRNLGCFVDLIARGELDIEPLVSGVFPVGDAVAVYDRLRTGELSGVGFLFQYPEGDRGEDADSLGDRVAFRDREPVRGTVRDGRRNRSARTSHGALRLGFIGAGNYATSMLLPHLAHLAEQQEVRLETVATRSSLSAVNAQRKFGFTRAVADIDAVLGDESIDAVFIVTRHSSHAALTCEALRTGKAVFVEKPLALTTSEVESILDTIADSGNDRLMVGFNRRFAPLFEEMRDRFRRPAGPVVTRYLVNAGPLTAKSWYGEEETEGSRFAGEGGHFVDLLNWWTDAELVEVTSRCAGAREDLEVNLRYDDGSLGTISYLVTGHPRFPKETFEAFAGGRAARMENFRRGIVWAGRRRMVSRSWRGPDKGQRRELDAFVRAVRADEPMPITLTSLITTTRATLTAAGADKGEVTPEGADRRDPERPTSAVHDTR